MGFLDNLRDRFSPQDDDYYDDDDYDNGDYYDDEPRRSSRTQDDGRGEATSGILGNTRRPEAESVSVYTRSGRPVSGNGAGAPASDAYATSRQTSSYSDYRRDDSYGNDSYESGSRYDDYHRGSGDYDASYVGSRTSSYEKAEPEAAQEPYRSHDSVLGTSNGPTPADIGLKAVPRPSSGQLPPYVLKPVSYDDVQMVVRRVKTNQPVVLAFTNTNLEVAKRILDFCFGLACGVDGTVDELGDRVFVVVPKDTEITQADIDKLVADGTIQKR